MNVPSVLEVPSSAQTSPVVVRRSSPRRWWILIAVAIALIVAGIVYEVRTSALEASFFSGYAKELAFETADGPSSRIAFPIGGPVDLRRGYSLLPGFQSRLEKEGFSVTRQAVQTPELQQLISWDVAPPYREAPVAGLMIYGSDESVLYDVATRDRVFHDFDEIPPLLVDSLLYIENRELPRPVDPRTNPVIEWDRQMKATLLYAASKLGFHVAIQGGSTLGTQMEKFEHSAEGRTKNPIDKLRQVVAASLLAYRNGPDTRPFRHEVVVDYLNSIPLSAAPGWGEVHGLGDGLYVWFGMRLSSVRDALTNPNDTPAKAYAYKHTLALLASLPAPSDYLIGDRASLNRRANEFARILEQAGIISADFAARVESTPLLFLPRPPLDSPASLVQRKGLNAVRTNLLHLLDVKSFYDLDGLDLSAYSTVDVGLQHQATALLQKLADRDFVRRNGLTEKRLLETGDPSKVLYSLLLFERTPVGNLLRVNADNLDQPFDISEGVKMELGSTAKLRTLAHYLEIVTSLYRELTPVLDAKAMAREAGQLARDPITRWAMETLARQPALDLDSFLQQALDRRYSASPYETFFTGGGIHTFNNFEPEENSRIATVREGLQQSINLVFIRLMRDLVRYHEARLPYDSRTVLEDQDDPLRVQMLKEIADDEARIISFHAYRRYRNLEADDVVRKLLGTQSNSPRHLAILYYAWKPAEAVEPSLGQWLRHWQPQIDEDEIARLEKAYGNNPRLNLLDFAYLLGRQPLEVWTAGALAHEAQLSWSGIVARGGEARQISSSWLLKTRNRHAQDVRLRIRIEKDAFEQMTPSWRRLAFPFRRLVPSYATAIGNSSDRPAALAELMGIILNDGIKRPSLRLTRLQFAQGTPYETVFEPAQQFGERVMDPAIARALRPVLADVVEHGTARRLSGAFNSDNKPIIAGGKTGSGDNRFKTFTRYGAVTSSHAVNRTATFVFYIGDRYFGVITAFVPGRDAEAYSFTSALPVSVLRLFAPTINEQMSTEKPITPGAENRLASGLISTLHDFGLGRPTKDFVFCCPS